MFIDDSVCLENFYENLNESGDLYSAMTKTFDEGIKRFNREEEIFENKRQVLKNERKMLQDQLDQILNCK